MVSKSQTALKALHRLLVHGRTMAFEGTPSQELAWFFDDIELLPALMMAERNTDEFFGEYLQEICIKFKCDYIFSQYQNNL
jgi:hypothetical protein